MSSYLLRYRTVKTLTSRIILVRDLGRVDPQTLGGMGEAQARSSSPNNETTNVKLAK